MFIARQPIFNRRLEVYGYELLYRSDLEARGFNGVDDNIATATVMGGVLENGLEHITDGTHAFINFNRDLIMSESIELMDPNTIVIEVLEDVTADVALVRRLKQLKAKRYKIALDDFVEDFESYPLMPVAQIIKFDLMATPLHTIEDVVKKAIESRKVLLAEKIETQEEFDRAKAMGFHLFQGYFFSKPKIVGQSQGKSNGKSQYTRLLMELKKDEPSYQVLAEIIETDVNLSYQLMKVIRHKQGDDLIYSIKKALVFMGIKDFERWVNIIMLQQLAKDKPVELLRLSLVRSKFSEYIALHSNYTNRKLEASMMCLFSSIDAILDQQMKDALADISVTEDIREALVAHEGTLNPLYDLVVSYERGEWDRVKELCDEIGIHPNELADGYFRAVQWGKETCEKFSGR